MNRRFFLKVTGFAAAAGALFEVSPVAAQSFSPQRDDGTPVPATYAPGTYQISGRVRLFEPNVEISGVTNAQQISWSDDSRDGPRLAGFTSFETFDGPWRLPALRVRGGHLESVAVVPINLG